MQLAFIINGTTIYRRLIVGNHSITQPHTGRVSYIKTAAVSCLISGDLSAFQNAFSTGQVNSSPVAYNIVCDPSSANPHSTACTVNNTASEIVYNFRRIVADGSASHFKKTASASYMNRSSKGSNTFIDRSCVIQDKSTTTDSHACTATIALSCRR